MARYVSLQVIKDLRFCQIEKTDHVPSAKATRLIIPLYSQFEAKVIARVYSITALYCWYNYLTIYLQGGANLEMSPCRRHA